MISRAWFAMALCLSAACGHKEPAVERFAVIRDSLASAPADESGSARRVFLNEEIRVYFEGQVDPLSVTPDTVRLRDVLDGRLVRGRLMVATRSVTFVPVPPCNPELDDGSLKPGRRYRLEVTGFPSTNAVRSTTGRVLARSHTREFATVDRDRSPSPFLPVGVGDPRCSRFEMTFFEPIAAEIGALRLYFNVPPVPGSVRPEAFHLRRLNSGVEPILITKARVVPPADFSGFATDYGNVSFYGNVSLFPGSVVELLLGTRVTPGRDVYLSLDHGDDALRDYGGRKVEDFGAGEVRQPVVTVPVQPGDRVRVFEVGFRKQMEFVSASPGSLGFSALDGVARPACRREGGTGKLGVLKPSRETVLARGVPFDRGDGTVVRSDDGNFEFSSVEIPAGVTVVLRGDSPLQVRTVYGLRVAGSLVLDRTPCGRRGVLDGEAIEAQDLIDTSGVALVAGGDVLVEGRIAREGPSHPAQGSPLTILSGGRIRQFGRIPAGSVLAPESLLFEGDVPSAKIVRARLCREAPKGADLVAEAWTPWLALPSARTRADEIRVEGLIGKIVVAIQLAPPNPLDPGRPIEDPGLMTQPLPLPSTAPIEWTPGSHVRFLLRAELAAGRPLPELSGIVFLGR